MSIDAMGPTPDIDRWRAEFEPEQNVIQDPDEQLPLMEPAPQRREKNVMHRWQELLLKAQMVVRDCEDRTSKLNEHFVGNVLSKYYDVQIAENNRKMFFVFATALAGSAFGIFNGHLKKGDPYKTLAVAGAKIFPVVSNMANVYYDGNRTTHERTKAAFDHYIQAVTRVADGQRNVLGQLDATQNRVDDEKRKAQGA